jgi:hypothetical protein
MEQRISPLRLSEPTCLLDVLESMGKNQILLIIQLLVEMISDLSDPNDQHPE